MTTPPENPEQDSQIAAAWRETSDEVPSLPLDTLVLAAARREIGGHSLPRATRRWRIPLAAAASLCVVALGVVLTRPEQPVIAPMSVNAPPPLTESVARPETTSSSERPLTSDKKRRAALHEVNSMPVAPAASAPDTSLADKAAGLGPSERRESAKVSGNVAEQYLGRAAGPAAAPVDAAAAIAHIQELHAKGQLAQAAQALRSLRAVAPEIDHRLPVELRAWAATVTP